MVIVIVHSHCRLGLFQDSDFSGDLEDSKSTSEGVLYIFGSRTFAPISWMCKKQTSVSHSSTGSEIISLNAGLLMDRCRRRTIHRLSAQPGEGFADVYWGLQWIQSDQYCSTQKNVQHWEWCKIRNTRGLGHFHSTGSQQKTFSCEYCTSAGEFGFNVLQAKTIARVWVD